MIAAQTSLSSVTGQSSTRLIDLPPSPQRAPVQTRTLWGLTPVELHARYWASRGVQVVRCGERCAIVDHAELYLLMDATLLAVFHPARLVTRLYWAGAELMLVRLRDDRTVQGIERVITDACGRFVGLKRLYDHTSSHMARVVLTANRALADTWQAAGDLRQAWYAIRRIVPPNQCLVDRIRCRTFDGRDLDQQASFVQHLAEFWPRPDMTIARARPLRNGAWMDPTARPAENLRCIGPVWIGAGRHVPDGCVVVGPAVLWDLPHMRPNAPQVRWAELEPTALACQRALDHARRRSPARCLLKRLFNIVFSLICLLLTLPLYPLVMACIWLEGGRPFFFGHLRETIGGREFRCWKFRSMRKDAEKIKRELSSANQADGPQLYLKDDPRLTRVGRIIRRLNIDELPQFYNVLKGEMSVVGPRPSPRSENQFCPAWREARLSVRPGITGLWQVMRTRRPGLDFQEWIKYDLEYVERMGMRLDLAIILETIRILIGAKRTC